MIKQSKISFIVFLLAIFLLSLSNVSASVCEAGNSAILDYNDSIQGWIDTQPPAQECIFGNYGNETCTADQQCDGKYTNTYSCNAGVGVAYCDNDCGYTLVAPLCNSECDLFTAPICDGLAPGTTFPDPDGDHTIDYCGDGPMDYYCHHVDTNICKSDFGADSYCDGIQADSYGDYNGDGTFDYCSSDCMFVPCTVGADNTCPNSMVCEEPGWCAARKVPEFNGHGLLFGLLSVFVGVFIIRRKH